MEKPRMIEFQHVVNRGANMNIATSDVLPFKVERIFWVYDVKKGAVRGEHGHKKSKQVVVAISGKANIKLIGIEGSVFEFILQNPKQGVYIPALYWGKITFAEDTVLLTFASDDYEESDYIRDFDEFLKLEHQ